MFTRQLAQRSARAVAQRRTYASVSEASGVKVAGIDNGQPTTSISVVVKAGSRFESRPGVAHALKNFAFKNTKAGSALKTVRETELYGGVLSSALTREHLFLNAEFLRGDEDYFLSLMSSVLSSTKFTPHEFGEVVVPTIEADSLAALSSPSTMAFDIAHTLAFRRGLGNSLFASPHTELTAENVKEYASKAFAKSNVAVIGTGISTEALEKAVAKAFGGASAAGGSSSSGPATQYFGGEQRLPLDLHAAEGQPTMLIAFGSTDAAATPALAVLKNVLGGESDLKWVPGTSPLALAAAKVPGGKAKAFVLPYSDASLFGVLVSAPTSEGVKAIAGDAVAAIKALGQVNEEALKKAVAKTKFEVASVVENKEGLIALTGPQVLSGSVKSLEDAFGAIEKASTESLSKAAAALFKGKPTVVAVGDLSVLPYADELGL
ncbi:hypothetical protein QFC21_006192 [Naganishia friedmannii]|uniref:Uncharacterized protein n=1 Tax=Naganishia friedmannii TaxID=89922 RepID=A0ACC2V5Y6_9TREE|nr:hypothetical protein QFC21_006192 [Naganishia friedmannii]